MIDSEHVTTATAKTARATKILIVAALALAIAAVVYAKRQPNAPRENADAGTAQAENTSPPAAAANTAQQAALPRLVDLGAGKCIPCKMMAPILENLKTEYAGSMNIQFIDVWVNPDAGKEYGIDVIPTQIFYDANGKERFRHQGFFSKEDILAKWKELGVNLTPAKS